MKKIFSLVGIICLVTLAVLIVWRLQKELTAQEAVKENKPAPVTVQLTEVRTGSISDIGNFTGSLEADSTFTISPKASGRITELNYKLGDTIKYGDIVARLDDREQLLAVQEQKAALLVAQANVASANAEVDKAEVEINSELANVESAKAQVESAEVAVENAEVQVTSAEVALKSTLVKIKNAKNDVVTAENNIASEKANLAAAEAQLTLAQQNLDREQKGLRDETSSQADFDAAQSNFDVQSASVKVAKSKLNTAENNLAIAKTDVEMAENDRDIAASKVDIAKSDLKIAHTKVTIAKTSLVNAQAKVANARTAKVIAEKQVVIAEEQVKKQEAVLAAAEERHSYTIIKAEWRKGEGAAERFVSERHVEPGALVAVNSSIISIVDNAKLKVAVTAIERDFARLNVGQKAVVFVQVSQDGNPKSKDNQFIGTIIRKSPVIDDISRQGRFEIEIDNKDGKLHPGAFARLEIQFAKHDDVLLVPTDALCQRDDKPGVFLSTGTGDDLKAAFIPVTTGIKFGHTLEIVPAKPEDRERLAKGSVVTIGNHLLKDGTEIRLPAKTY